ncbi:hypothetical protein BS78_05G235400 [Paspalum vaginatum]|nr:hypothetical protein BS78_05G235400 [Paspalum vaginatum]
MAWIQPEEPLAAAMAGPAGRRRRPARGTGSGRQRVALLRAHLQRPPMTSAAYSSSSRPSPPPPSAPPSRLRSSPQSSRSSSTPTRRAGRPRPSSRPCSATSASGAVAPLPLRLMGPTPTS